MNKIKYFIYALIGLVLSYSSFLFFKQQEEKRIKIAFEKQSIDRINLIRNTLNSTEVIVESVHNFFISSNKVTKDEFKSFVTSYSNILLGFQAIEWIPKVINEDKNEFINYARKTINKDFQITQLDSSGKMVPVSEREIYFPVYFLEPYQNNERALGFDLASNPTRKETLYQAAKLKKITASSRITLVQEKENEFGILLFDPVYKNSKNNIDDNSFLENLNGFVLGVIRPKAIIQNSMELIQDVGINIELVDNSAPEGEQKLFSLESTEEIESTELRYIEEFNFGERKWAIICSPNNLFYEKFFSFHPIYIFLFSMVLASFIIYFLWRNDKETEKVNKLVNEKTRELNKSKDRLDMAINTANLGIWEWDFKKSKIFYSEKENKIFTELFEKLQISTDSWHNYIHKEDLNGILDKLTKHISGVSENFEAEFRVLTKDQSWKWIHLFGKITKRNENKEPLNAVGMLMNINDRKEDQQKLFNYSKKLEKENLDKSKLFSIISHDLKSPLVSLQGFADLIANDINDLSTEDIRKYSKYLKRSSDSLAAILNGLLEWGKLQLGKIKFNPKTFLLNDVCENVVNQFLPVAVSKNVKLISNCDKNSKVFADQTMVEIIIRNLVSNAIKFTSDGGLIEISSQITKNNEVMVSIKDNGVGMEDEYLKNILKDTYHISTEGTAGEKGTGLGLSISKELIERNGGQIWVTSKVNAGTEIKFTLALENSCEL